MLALYGHPFSSYTWKALIALYAYEIPFDFRVVDADHPENGEFVAAAGPLGKFPVLKDGDNVLFESTAIIEYLSQRHRGEGLLPEDASAALGVRMLDRVFDNYVMNIMQIAVNEAIRTQGKPDPAALADVRAQLTRTYAWLEGWLEYYPPIDHITLIECSAAPSLFYADWVHQIGDEFPRLKHWRAHLLSLEPIARCVEDARPFRPFFPLGAPDRD
ncbi:glutathione S-transferase family protein [Novosphingobium sp. G106]|uniref:glutathione S-transferase family protein n=1 Tax=Novosphingobium sp. G106 TaxID=2849500 RepID=UPI001C2DCA89|nr:glutathione S-transferase family protein [Novosphingobium sp. G106]MBV1688086.1 glutathione S-transferase family protein [Novosphingobium sp. G106]